MNRSLGTKLVLLGFLGGLLINCLLFLANLLKMTTSSITSIFNLVSLLVFFVILVGFFFARDPKNSASNLVFISYLVSVLIRFIRPIILANFETASPPAFIFFVFNILVSAYLLFWAYKMMSNNMLVAVMLGGVFLWNIILYSVISNFLGYSILVQLVNIAVSAIPVFAAYSDQ